MNDLVLKEIPLHTISPDFDQPRHLVYSIDELLDKVKAGDQRFQSIWESLTSLANSILEVGLQQPITVYPSGEGYTIYDGHRRWLAMQLLQRQGLGGDGTILCYVRSKPELEQEALLGQLSINTQREDFNVFELARSLRQVYTHLRTTGGSLRVLRDDGGIDTIDLNHDTPDGDVWTAIERMIGISRSRRYQINAVLKLSPSIQELAEEAGIPESTLRYLIPIEDEQMQETIIEEILSKNLSNAEIRARIKSLQDRADEAPVAAMPKPIQIESALKPIHKLVKEVEMVKNVAGAVSEKDPRTVARYRETIPLLRSTLEDMEQLLKKLEFLEGGR